jgi:hypothetical protein
MDSAAVISRLQLPFYSEHIRAVLGDVAACIIDTLILHGKVTNTPPSAFAFITTLNLYYSLLLQARWPLTARVKVRRDLLERTVAQECGCGGEVVALQFNELCRRMFITRVM